MAGLKQRGGHLTYHDPYAPHLAGRDWPGGADMSSVPFGIEELADADCVVIVTDHTVLNYQEILSHARLIVDTRNALKGSWPHVFKLGAP
jgi:UDP-N-acetyl-D-glucosamine dehydrogenase